MIDCFSGDTFGVLPCPFWSTVLQRGAKLPIHFKLALLAHRYTYVPPHCRTLQHHRTFIPLSVSLWNDLANPVFDSVGLAGFKSRAPAFLLA